MRPHLRVAETVPDSVEIEAPALRPPHLGILTGLEMEARLLRPYLPAEASLPATIAISGATASGARRALERLIDAGATHILSWGMAGGLDAQAEPGQLLMPELVFTAGKAPIAVDVEWRRAALALLGAAAAGPILGSDEAVIDPVAKRRLVQAFAEEERPIAIDMESHVAASAAGHAALLVIRVVIDRAEISMPPAALAALGAAGRTDFAALALSLARRPNQIPALLRLARAARAARGELLRCARRGGGSGFGLV